MTTLNKLPQPKPDLVRVDKSWEEWSLEGLIDALQKWLRINHVESSKCEKHLFSQKQVDKLKPYCLFCRKQEYWSEDCTLVTALADRKKFFVDHNLCFNCGRSNHEQTSAVGVFARCANTSIIETYAIDRRGKAVIQVECH